jgi:endonuclease YncB( thermonuclease family)
MRVMTRLAALTLLLPLLLVGGVQAAPDAQSSATCSDYSNQRQAQLRKDTRDADGDGIYCESLPCPCLRPGGGGDGGTRPRRPRPKPRKRAQVIAARITSVVDGDTVRVRAFGARRSLYTVRLIGIDTPETKRPGTPIECGGREASANMRELAFTEDGEGRRVTLTTDPTQDTFDRYNRLLAYIQTVGGTQLQVEQLSDGWAKVYVFERRFRKYSRFRRAQSRARTARRGVWGRCAGNFHRRA